MYTAGAVLPGLARPSVTSAAHTKRSDGRVVGLSVVSVLACMLTCTSSSVSVPSLAIPLAHDEGRYQDGIIKGPSAGSSRGASMRSSLGATRAAAFLTC
jgi:hypothetical protein